MLLFSGNSSETPSDDMVSGPLISDSPSRRRSRAIHGNHDQSRHRKKARLVETSSPIQLDVNWPGNLTTADSEMEMELENSQRELQGEYTGQIDPALITSTPASNHAVPWSTTVPATPKLPEVGDQVPHPTNQALVLIQNEAHLNRLQLQRQMDKGKGTNEAYPRHVKNYEKFWEADQDRRAKLNANHIRTPAHPIIGEKVSLFLFHEMTRNKVRLGAFLISYLNLY